MSSLWHSLHDGLASKLPVDVALVTIDFRVRVVERQAGDFAVIERPRFPPGMGE